MEEERKLLTTIEAANYLGLGKSTLDRMRIHGDGPVFIKYGPGQKSKVLYDQRDIDDWIDSRRRLSTKD